MPVRVGPGFTYFHVLFITSAGGYARHQCRITPIARQSVLSSSTAAAPIRILNRSYRTATSSPSLSPLPPPPQLSGLNVLLVVKSVWTTGSIAVHQLGRRHQMARQHRRQLMSVQLNVDQMHGQRKLIHVQLSVHVHVRQLPDLAQHRVRQLWLDHLRLGTCNRESRERNAVATIC